MKANLSIIALGLVLASCAAAPQPQWDKDGASSYQRTSDQSECEYQIRMNKAPKDQQDHLMTLCMQGKGYRLKPAS